MHTFGKVFQCLQSQSQRLPLYSKSFGPTYQTGLIMHFIKFIKPEIVPGTVTTFSS